MSYVAVISRREAWVGLQDEQMADRAQTAECSCGEPGEKDKGDGTSALLPLIALAEKAEGEMKVFTALGNRSVKDESRSRRGKKREKTLGMTRLS